VLRNKLTVSQQILEEGMGKPLEFCNQDVALHATLGIKGKLRAYAEKGNLRFWNSYATYLMKAVSYV
jgi:hypothetical protein